MRLSYILALALLLAPAAHAQSTHAERDWTGTYAVRLRLATDTHLPLLLGTRHSVTTSYALAHVSRTAQGWMQEQRVCDLRIAADAPMRFSPTFAASLPDLRFTPTFSADGYQADLGVQAIGFDPAVTHGAVPERADAPGVVDSDRDGRPGATVTGRFPLVGSVDIYFAERMHLVLHGRETHPGRIVGTLEVLDFRQRTLGASSRFLRRSMEVTPDPRESGFVMVAVPPGFSCDDLRRTDPTLRDAP